MPTFEMADFTKLDMHRIADLRLLHNFFHETDGQS